MYCRTQFIHGGVAIYVNNNSKLKIINRSDIDALSVDKDFEVRAVELISIVKESKLVIIAVYRSPQGCFKVFVNKFNKLLQNVTKDRKARIVISGDFNVNFNLETNETTEVLDLISQFDLSLLMSQHTNAMPK
jgi:exonuclease III